MDDRGVAKRSLGGATGSIDPPECRARLERGLSRRLMAADGHLPGIDGEVLLIPAESDILGLIERNAVRNTAA